MYMGDSSLKRKFKLKSNMEVGKTVLYCPDCDWGETDAAGIHCPECGSNKLRMWKLTEEDMIEQDRPEDDKLGDFQYFITFNVRPADVDLVTDAECKKLWQSVMDAFQQIPEEQIELLHGFRIQRVEHSEVEASKIVVPS